MPTMSGSIPRQVGPGFIRKVAEHDPGSKSINGIHAYFLLLFLTTCLYLEFLSRLAFLVDSDLGIVK